MALTAEEQKFYDWVVAQIPRHYFSIDRMEELTQAFAKIFGEAQETGADLFDQTLIQNATNLPPDFLHLHALDRGTSRQDGESDTNLRTRLSTFPDAVTPTAILDGIQTVLDDQGISGSPALVELRRDRAFMLQNLEDSGTGGVFALSGSGEVLFTPDTAFARPPSVGDDITLSGSNSPANDGTFTITDLEGAGVVYTNGSFVAETDGGVSWTHTRTDGGAYVTDGFRDAYFDRGYRIGGTPPGNIIIVILPFGCTASTEAAVREALRQKKGAGIGVLVECRQNP